MAAGNRRVQLLALAWTAAAIVTLPFFLGWSAPSPAAGFALELRQALGYFVALALCCGIYRRELHRLSRSQAFAVVFLVALLTCILNQLHNFNVDYGADYFDDVSNSAWQAQLHSDVMNKALTVAPHAARFLPNAIVRWFELGGMSFEAARDLYRMIFVLLLFYAIYCYARLHTTHLGALIALLLTAVIYPVSFEYYAGQLTDPLAHLSFVLAFIFLAKQDFAALFATIMIGAIAKENVLVMTGYYVLFRYRDPHYTLRAGALTVGSLVAYFGLRIYVLGGLMHYSNISGVTTAHIPENWQDTTWILPFLLTAGALLPFLVLGWRTTPRSLKQTALYLLPVLFSANLMFSWLHESRNFMPLVFVLAVVAARTLTQQTASQA
jgi:hypothetical protein